MPDVFPFQIDRTRSAGYDKEHYESNPYSGPTKVLERGNIIGSYSLVATVRTQAEWDTVKAFQAAHLTPTPFYYRDYRYYPFRDVLVKFASSLREQGSQVSLRFNYSFDVVEV